MFKKCLTLSQNPSGIRFFCLLGALNGFKGAGVFFDIDINR